MRNGFPQLGVVRRGAQSPQLHKIFLSGFLRLAVVAAVLALTTCRSHFSSHALEYAAWLGLPTDVPVYLAHNAWINPDGTLTAVNQQQTGRLISFGTELRIVSSKEGEIVVKIAGTNEMIKLVNDHAESFLPDQTAFARMLTKANKSSLAEGIAPETLAKIELGQVTVGMTKEEVILSQGFPMKGRTPHLDTTTWSFRLNDKTLRRVIYKNDKVVHIAD